MNKAKNFITLALLTSLCSTPIYSAPLVANAANDSAENELLSTDDFIQAIKDEYSEYGIDIQVQDQSNAQPITQDMLDTYIQNIEKQQTTEPETSNNGTTQILVNSNTRLRSKAATTTTKCTANKQVSNTYGHANLKVTASISHSGKTFQKCNSLKSSQSGGAINFDKWKQTSYSKTPLISLLPGHVRYTVKGKLTTSFSLAGVKFTSTTNESFSVEFVFS